MISLLKFFRGQCADCIVFRGPSVGGQMKSWPVVALDDHRCKVQERFVGLLFPQAARQVHVQIFCWPWRMDMNPATTIMCTALRPESAASYELACRYRRASVSTNWLFVRYAMQQEWLWCTQVWEKHCWSWKILYSLLPIVVHLICWFCSLSDVYSFILSGGFLPCLMSPSVDHLACSSSLWHYDHLASSSLSHNDVPTSFRTYSLSDTISKKAKTIRV